MKNNKKIIFSLLFFSFLLPLSAKAEMTQLCWNETACEEARGSDKTQGFVWAGDDNGASEACDGKTIHPFLKNQEGQFEKLGLCLPAGKAVTEIYFGGKNEFFHIGDFIKYMYRYGIIIMGIISVIVIINAGFIWATSRGNSEKITAATKKITGALMGLFLAVGSYLILNTINPALVNLRLPQLWMVNTSSIAPTYCSDLDDGKRLAIAHNADQQLTQEQLKEKYKASIFDITDVQTAACGIKYFVEGSDTLTCDGTYCASDNPNEEFTGVCVALPIKEGGPKKPVCVKGNLVIHYKLQSFWQHIVKGSILYGSLLGLNIEENWLDKTTGAGSDFKFYPICKKGSMYLTDNDKTQNWDNDGKDNEAFKNKKYDPNKFSQICNKEHTQVILSKEGDGTPEYWVIFYNLAGNCRAHCNKDDSGNCVPMEISWCNPGETFEGFALQNQINVAADNNDSYIYLGKSNGNSAIFDRWQKIKPENLITEQDLSKGMFLEAKLNDTNLKNSHDCPNQVPDECCDGYEKDLPNIGGDDPVFQDQKQCVDHGGM